MWSRHITDALIMLHIIGAKSGDSKALADVFDGEMNVF